MSIGYACLTYGNPDIRYQALRRNNATQERLAAVCEQNLQALDAALTYNIANGIRLFRITSDLIPLATAMEYPFCWQEQYQEIFAKIGCKAREAGMRLSMHPGQYTVLNSTDARIVSKAVDDLKYHCDVLDLLGTDCSNKIILHVGGVYGNRKDAAERFIETARNLEDRIRNRLVIENDERNYNAESVLQIAKQIGIPAVFDNLHHAVNPSESEYSAQEWIEIFSETWHKADGRQKIHYSQQGIGKRTGAHSDTIDAEQFVKFYSSLSDKRIDIMLEVKDKDLSAMKCMHCITDQKRIEVLESDWARYKYSVLEHDPNSYASIRALLKDKKNYPAFEFFHMVDNALKRPVSVGTTVNAAQHVWGYFKKEANPKETARFDAIVEMVQSHDKKPTELKRYLKQMQRQYQNSFLAQSYYFIDFERSDE